MIVTGDESIETFIDLANIDLSMLQRRDNNPFNYYESKVFLEKQLGHHIDLMNTTITEYYSIIKAVQKMKDNG